MKRGIFVVMAVLAGIFGANAQTQGEKAAGFNILFGSGDSYSNVGIGAKFQYNVTDPLRLEGSASYYLKKDNVSMWEIAANGHWLFPVADRVTVYPLAGLSFMGVRTKVGNLSDSNSDFGINLGGGAGYRLTEAMTLGAELRYRIGGDWDRLIFALGATWAF